MGGKLPRVGGKIPQGILPPGGASCPGGQEKLLHRLKVNPLILRYILETKIKMNIQQMDRIMDGHTGSQHDTIIPCH